MYSCKDNSDNVIDIDTRSVTKKNQDTHVTFGPVLYKAKDFNKDYKLHIDTYSDQDFNDSEYLSEIKLILPMAILSSSVADDNFGPKGE